MKSLKIINYRHLKEAKGLGHVIVSLSILSIFLTPQVFANMVGNDTQNFNASANPKDFVTVRSSKTLSPGHLSLSLFSDLATNTLPYSNPGSDYKASRLQVNDSLLSADLGLAYGVWNQWELGLHLPQLLMQSVKSQDDRGQFTDNGSTEIRLYTKYEIMEVSGIGIAGAGTISINRTKENPYTGEKNDPIYTLEFIADKGMDLWNFAANLGYRWRSAKAPADSNSPTRAFSNQVLGSVAVAYKIPEWKHQFVTEVYSSRFAENRPKFLDRSPDAAEINFSMKYLPKDDLTVHYGTGTELYNGISTPDLRLFAGIQYQIPVMKQLSSVATLPVAIEDKPKETVVLQDIFFEFNSSELSRKQGSLKALDDLGSRLMADASLRRLVIEGHTCSIGGETYNDRLSQKRAIAIKRYLISNYRLSTKQVAALGRGERYPIANNDTELGREKNRRVEFKIYE